MKRLLTILLLVTPICLMAQKKTGDKAPSSATAIFVLDGQKTDEATVKALDPNSILEMRVLKDPSAAKAQGIDPEAGKAFIITKKYAIHQYQEVFSSFSDDLESWLTSHGDDDAQFRYFVNGIEVPKDNAGIGKLYAIKKENIEGVTMVQDEPAGSKYAAKIKITTKK